jgi:hypothetical protein
MFHRSLKLIALLATLATPVPAFAGAGEPGAGQGNGSNSPASQQPTAPKQDMPTEGRASAPDPASSTTIPEKIQGQSGKTGEGN